MNIYHVYSYKFNYIGTDGVKYLLTTTVDGIYDIDATKPQDLDIFEPLNQSITGTLIEDKKKVDQMLKEIETVSGNLHTIYEVVYRRTDGSMVQVKVEHKVLIPLLNAITEAHGTDCLRSVDQQYTH
jgi:hypothetical protein